MFSWTWLWMSLLCCIVSRFQPKPVMAFSAASTKVIEIETKFRIDSETSDDIDTTTNDDNTNDGVRNRLEQLGFIQKRKIRFVDHYYDTEQYTLSLRDTWLRFRASSSDSGNWQLKRGKNVSSATTTAGESKPSSSTIYEETEGEDAIQEVMKILEDDNTDNTIVPIDTSNSEGEGQLDCFLNPPRIPTSIPPNIRLLTSFCSLETIRESYEWSGCARINSSENDENDGTTFEGISVDLDHTNLGYAVGEVEKVVQNESEIQEANKEIETLLDQILQHRPRKDPPRGKLEYFLKMNRQDHYQALIRSGVIRE